MKTSAEPLNGAQVRLKASFTAEEVQKEYDELLLVYAKTARVKGFRPGKAPANMVEKIYQKEIATDIREHLRAKGLSEAAKTSGRTILGERDLVEGEIQPGNGIDFELTIHVEPEIKKMPEYKELELDCPARTQSVDARVEEDLMRRRIQAGTFEDADDAHVLKLHDMAAVSFDATLDGKPLAEVLPDAKELAHSDEMWLLLDEQYAPMPEFVQPLVGLKVGGTKKIPVTFSAEFAVEDLKGKTVDFDVKVIRVRKNVPAELDAEFFKRYDVKDEAELRQSLAKLMDYFDTAQLEDAHRMAIIQKLLDKADFDLPAPRVARLTQLAFHWMVGQLSRSRMPLEQLRARMEELREDLYQLGEIQTRAACLLLAIAREEKITASGVEVKQRGEQSAMQAGYRTPKEWAKGLEFPEDVLMECVEENLLCEKAFRYIEKHAKFTGVEKDLAAGTYDDARALPPWNTLAENILRIVQTADAGKKTKKKSK